MQVLKLSLDSCSDPVHVVVDVVVTVVESTARLKVTEIELLVATFVAPSAGLVAVTLSAADTTRNSSPLVSESDLPQPAQMPSPFTVTAVGVPVTAVPATDFPINL